MNSRLIATTMVLTCLICPGVWARDDGASTMAVMPVETFTCDYNDGKGPADLDKATAAWNRWMDERGAYYTYAALTLTPYYFGADTFDVGWLGIWPSGEAMGRGIDLYLGQGSEYARAFADVVTCDTHSNFAGATIKSPPGDAPDNLVLFFSDCNVHDGAGWDAVMAGLAAWSDYMTKQAYDNGVWILFPAFGGADMDYDFKYVTSHDDFASAGKAYDKFGNGGGWEKRQELLGELLDCDVPRAYTAKFRRKPRAAPAPD